MLSQAKLQSIILTSQIAESEKFYRDTLGLTLRTKSDASLTFDVGGSDLNVFLVPSTNPSEHTVLGFSVPDVEAAVAFLYERGVTLRRFDGFPHDEKGVLETPDGARVAWFHDPDGNLLSVVQYNTLNYVSNQETGSLT